MNDAELLALHRDLVAVPSVSGHEREIADYVAGWLAAQRLPCARTGDNLYTLIGERGPLLCLNTHLDTVPAAPSWSRPPHEPTIEHGHVYGLGANDAKASVAAMLAAFVRLASARSTLGCRVLLTLVAGEETGGKGSEALLPELAAGCLEPDAVIVGEPTGLDVAVAQKGLLVLKLVERGTSCHAAHGRTLGADNALRSLARDLVAVDVLDFGPEHPALGPVTVEPTVAGGGTAKNMVPASATCVLDVRTNPEPSHEAIIARVAAAVRGEVEVVSKRLRPCAVDPGDPLVRAAVAARPEARLFGSRGVSDLVFFPHIPGIKVGPGDSARSHTPDEFVLESEITAGARFYERVVLAFGELATARAAGHREEVVS